MLLSKSCLVVQEFEPWLKWVMLDALLSLAITLLATRVQRVKPALRAIGWL